LPGAVYYFRRRKKFSCHLYHLTFYSGESTSIIVHGVSYRLVPLGYILKYPIQIRTFHTKVSSSETMNIAIKLHMKLNL
jgi:hypothetical protein